MFGYTQKELLECFMLYPKYHLVALPNIMQFLLLIASPLLSEKEKKEMTLMKKHYDFLLLELTTTREVKKKTVLACLQTLYEAVSLYEQSFDRIANSYFEKVYN